MSSSRQENSLLSRICDVIIVPKAMFLPADIIRLLISYCVSSYHFSLLLPYRALFQSWNNALLKLELSWTCPNNLTTEQIKSVLKRYTNITSVDMRYVRAPEKSVAVFKNAKKLKSFQGTSLSIEACNLFHEFPYLESLSLCSKDTATKLCHLTALKSLVINTPHEQPQLVLHDLQRQLTSLHLYTSHPNSKVDTALAGFTNLTDLKIYVQFLQADPPFQVSRLKYLTNLQKLSMHRNFELDESNVLQCLTQLRELELIGYNWPGITTALPQLPHLEKLSCQMDVNERLEPLEYCTSLRSLKSVPALFFLGPPETYSTAGTDDGSFWPETERNCGAYPDTDSTRELISETEIAALGS